MARVLLHSLVFAPDGDSTAVLMTELALALQELGHEVTVLTTTPHSKVEAEALARQPLSPKWDRFLYQSDCYGIRVLHVSIPLRGTRVFKRLLDYTQFHALSVIAGLTLTGRYDVILAPSPPLTIGLVAWLLARVRRVPFIYNVQEIYPDIAVSLGVLRNRRLIRALEWLERFIYRRARVVIVISEAFRRRLRAKGVSDAKLRVIPNFVDTAFVQPGNAHNAFSRAHELEGKFVVLYAGNIGLTQSFETILAAARRLKHLPDLRFLIVGDGSRRKWLEGQLAQADIDNIVLLPFQPRSIVPQIYACSSVCLVPLKHGTARETFPSKIYTIMAAGRPVIVAADSGSELAWVVEEAKCGWSVPPDDVQALVAVIEEAYRRRDELDEKGQCGRAYVVEHHSRQAVARQYSRLIEEIAAKRQRPA